MLIGIVLSIPFVVFTVYSVLTLYIDENGYMRPKSGFLKIHRNENRSSGVQTSEEIVNESIAVMSEQPDFLVKFPPLFSSGTSYSIGPRSRRNLAEAISKNVTKKEASLRKKFERMLEGRAFRSKILEEFKVLIDNMKVNPKHDIEESILLDRTKISNDKKSIDFVERQLSKSQNNNFEIHHYKNFKSQNNNGLDTPNRNNVNVTVNVTDDLHAPHQPPSYDTPYNEQSISSTPYYEPSKQSTSHYGPTTHSSTYYGQTTCSTPYYRTSTNSTPFYGQSTRSSTYYGPTARSSTYYGPTARSSTYYGLTSRFTAFHGQSTTSSTNYEPLTHPDTSNSTSYLPKLFGIMHHLPEPSSILKYLPDSSSITNHLPGPGMLIGSKNKSAREFWKSDTNEFKESKSIPVPESNELNQVNLNNNKSDREFNENQMGLYKKHFSEMNDLNHPNPNDVEIFSDQIPKIKETQSDRDFITRLWDLVLYVWSFFSSLFVLEKEITLDNFFVFKHVKQLPKKRIKRDIPRYKDDVKTRFEESKDNRRSNEDFRFNTTAQHSIVENKNRAKLKQIFFWNNSVVELIDGKLLGRSRNKNTTTVSSTHFLAALKETQSRATTLKDTQPRVSALEDKQSLFSPFKVQQSPATILEDRQLRAAASEDTQSRTTVLKKGTGEQTPDKPLEQKQAQNLQREKQSLTAKQSRATYFKDKDSVKEEKAESSWFNYLSLPTLSLPTTYIRQMLGLIYNNCPLPKKGLFTFYSIKDCPSCAYGAHDSQLLITCAASHLMPSDVTVVCHQGEWRNGKSLEILKEIPSCKKKRDYARCPQLTVTGVHHDISCLQRGFLVDCDTPNITWYPGTELEVRCSPYYKAQFEVTPSEDGRGTTMCRENGIWTQNNVSCVPVCGVLGQMSAATPLIMHGSQAPPGSVPWAAALFLKDAGNLDYICSASIISDRAIITAAHCVYTREPGDLFLLVGSSELKTNESMLKRVAEIKIPLSYTDQQGNYGSDIAVLLINTTLQFSKLVQPICMDWNGRMNLEDNSLGKVTGWGLDQTFNESSHLSLVDVPVVSVAECSKTFSEGFKKFIGYTNFCAGYTNGTGVCNGDSGGGFIMEMKSVWYLAGTVSISPRQLTSLYCEPRSYSLYTKTKLFLAWIKEVLGPTVKNTTLIQQG